VPIYEYQCKECSHRFERLVGFNAATPDCPECGGEVEQLVSAPAVQFKGSGWYVTDYARSTSGPANAKAADGKAAADKAGDKKPETKPESKPETKKESSGEKKS
jgi:putative FmdB family regulatory protein